MDQPRYLLFLDILGFTELVENREAEHVYAVIQRALAAFRNWEHLNHQFRTIYFSDTFLFYQLPPGYGDWAFLDAYAIGGMVLSALLANGIPARGAISFGEFHVRQDDESHLQIYFGPALVEAYRSQSRESWIGISILRSAWAPFEEANPGTVRVFESEGVWLQRNDDVLLLNPFIKLRGAYADDQMGEITTPYHRWDAPEFPNELRALRFLQDKAAEFADAGDFSGRTAIKYHATLLFLRRVLGADTFEWATRISRRDDA